jgi:hypothetical protein
VDASLTWSASSENTDFSVSPAIQAEYLSYPAKIFGREEKFVPVQLRPSGEFDAVRFQFNEHINRMYGNPGAGRYALP